MYINFAFSFSGSIQEEGQQDPPKMEVLKGHNGCPTQTVEILKRKGVMGCPRQTIESPARRRHGGLSLLLFSPFFDVSSSSSSSSFTATSLS